MASPLWDHDGLIIRQTARCDQELADIREMLADEPAVLNYLTCQHGTRETVFFLLADMMSRLDEYVDTDRPCEVREGFEIMLARLMAWAKVCRG